MLTACDGSRDFTEARRPLPKSTRGGTSPKVGEPFGNCAGTALMRWGTAHGGCSKNWGSSHHGLIIGMRSMLFNGEQARAKLVSSLGLKACEHVGCAASGTLNGNAGTVRIAHPQKIWGNTLHKRSATTAACEQVIGPPDRYGARPTTSKLDASGGEGRVAKRYLDFGKMNLEERQCAA